MPHWYVFVLLSGVTGMLRLRRWTVFVWPLASVCLGLYAVATEPTNYDMHGFGYFVGAVAAVVCVITWLLGRGLASLAHRGSGRGGPSA